MMFPENIWIKNSERAALTGYLAKRRSRACRASADLPLLDRGVKRVHVNMDDFSRSHLGTIRQPLLRTAGSYAVAAFACVPFISHSA